MKFVFFAVAAICTTASSHANPMPAPRSPLSFGFNVEGGVGAGGSVDMGGNADSLFGTVVDASLDAGTKFAGNAMNTGTEVATEVVAHKLNEVGLAADVASGLAEAAMNVDPMAALGVLANGGAGFADNVLGSTEAIISAGLLHLYTDAQTVSSLANTTAAIANSMGASAPAVELVTNAAAALSDSADLMYGASGDMVAAINDVATDAMANFTTGMENSAAIMTAAANDMLNTASSVLTAAENITYEIMMQMDTLDDAATDILSIAATDMLAAADALIGVAVEMAVMGNGLTGNGTEAMDNVFVETAVGLVENSMDTMLSLASAGVGHFANDAQLAVDTINGLTSALESGDLGAGMAVIANVPGAFAANSIHTSNEIAGAVITHFANDAALFANLLEGGSGTSSSE